MSFIVIFFVILSVSVLSYLIYLFRSKNRLPILAELFFLGVYGVVLLFVLFPNLLRVTEETFGIASAINFIVYASIFISYFLILILYRKTEEQRVEITKLVREISYLKKGKK